MLAITFFMHGSGIAFAQIAARDVIAHVEGTVYLNGRRLDPSSSELPLRENSIVRTETGRVKVLLASGDSVFLGENGSVRFTSSPGLNSGRFEILSGSAVVITGELGSAVACEEQVQLSDSGVFRFDVRHVLENTFCLVRVFKGAAAAQMPSFVWVLTIGEMLDLNHLCGDHTPRNKFNIEDIDSLDSWSRQSQ